MQAHMITGLFKHEPCELHIKNKSICVSFPETDRIILIAPITEVSLNRTQNGISRMTFTTGKCQYDFLLDDAKNEEETAAMIFELTKDNTRLELRTQ